MADEPEELERTVPVAAVYDALASGLGEVMPGIEIVDRDLELGDGMVANLIGHDHEGRLVLVLMVEAEGPEVVLGALDALAYARRHGALIRRHLGRPEVRPELDPALVLVGEHFEPKSAQRLEPLVGRGIELFEVHTLRSQGGEQAYLLPVGAGEGAAPGDGESRLERFLRTLAPELRELAELVVQRMERVDEEIDLSISRGQLVWRQGAVELASLIHSEGGLTGRVPGDDRPLRMETSFDLERFLERVLSRYLKAVLNAEDDEPDESRPRRPAPDGPVEEPLALLTAEELEAFRQ